MAERFRGELLTMWRYTNQTSFYYILKLYPNMRILCVHIFLIIFKLHRCCIDIFVFLVSLGLYYQYYLDDCIGPAYIRN